MPAKRRNASLANTCDRPTKLTKTRRGRISSLEDSNKKTGLSRRTAGQHGQLDVPESGTSSESVKQTEAPAWGILDVIFAVDNTGSLVDYLDEVKTELKNIVMQLHEGHKSRYSVSSDVSGGYWAVPNVRYIYIPELVDLGTDLREICEFVTRVKSNVQDKRPEIHSQILRLAREEFSWRPGSQRLLFIIANKVPRELEETDSGGQYDWRDECVELNKMGVNVYGVEVGPGQDMIAEFHKEMATLTGGGHIKPPELEHVYDFILMIWYYMKLQKPTNQTQSRRVIKRTIMSTDRNKTSSKQKVKNTERRNKSPTEAKT